MSTTTRRRWLHGLVAVGGIILLPDVRNRGLARAAANDETFMNRAFDMKADAERSGDQSYGAVVVANQDPTAHAEMEAIRDAARTLGSRSLEGCVIYATSRPCRMCETAAYWANISHIYYGHDLNDGGRPGYSSC